MRITTRRAFDRLGACFQRLEEALDQELGEAAGDAKDRLSRVYAEAQDLEREFSEAKDRALV